jgi:methylenetetrahydrofolate dehydrogenase (NADP+) / methenyltetrahydrofolate cyclohydrolase
MIINGREIASQILEELRLRVDKLIEKGITPHLYIFLLTDNPSTLSYIKQKNLYAEKIGAKITVENLNTQTKTNELLENIKELNKNNNVHGIIVQRPTPDSLDLEKIDNAIIPEKEIDGFSKNTKYKIPVAKAIAKILRETKTDLNKKSVVVIGKGKTAGKPIINYLKQLGVTPLIIDSKTINPEQILRTADVVISAVGKSGVVLKENLKNGAILIGVGMHKEEDGKFHGDFDEVEISEKVSYYTPTPGGVGPVNVACLLQNLVEAAETLSK